MGERALDARLADLRRPFTAAAVRFKPQTWNANRKVGLAICYIDARLVVERLNLVAGFEWFDEYEEVAPRTLLCRLTVHGTTRQDVGVADSGAAGGLKALYSDALKRAAVRFGVGVSLYASPRMRLGPNDVFVREGKVKGLTDHGEARLRNQYQQWLDARGKDAFGEAYDHGDVEDSAGENVDAPVELGDAPSEPAPAAAPDPDDPPRMSEKQRKSLFAAIGDALPGVAQDARTQTLRMIVAYATKGEHTLRTLPPDAVDAVRKLVKSLKENPDAARDALRNYFKEHPEHKPAKHAAPEAAADAGPTPTSQPQPNESPGSSEAKSSSTGSTPTGYRPPEGGDVASRDERIAWRILACGEEPTSVDDDEKVTAAVRRKAVKKHQDAHAAGEAPWSTSGPINGDEPSIAEQFDQVFDVLKGLHPNEEWAVKLEERSQALFERSFDQLDDAQMTTLVAEMRELVRMLRAKK